MNDRSAVDTITGYFYQFDVSILSVLQLTDPAHSIEVECVEDVDIRTATDLTAVQCKYYAKTEYNHSVIKDAVMAMLTHFKAAKDGGRPLTSYMLRGHFAAGQEKLKDGIDLDSLKKNFLTYTKEKVRHEHHVDLGVSDAELQEFLGVMKVDVNAPEFTKQFEEVIRLLQTEFNCTRFSAEFFYYNNALRIIRELSICQTPAGRTITKRAFLERTNTSSVLFNEWFVEKRGKKKHLAALRAEYFTELNVSPHERFFLLEVDPTTYVRDELKDIIHLVSSKWSKTSKREPRPFCPYVYVHNIPEQELLSLKKDLHSEGFKFIDGHDFLGSDFSTKSITEAATHLNGIKVKLISSLNQVQDTLDAIAATRKIYQFHRGEPFFVMNNPSIGHTRIQVEKLSDVKEIV